MVVLSVIIPTRNREDMLQSLLATCRQLSSESVEFIIVDNSDKPVVNNLPEVDKRFKIVRSESRLSMTSNWTFGIAQASGAWRVFIGDDDGVIPGELDRLVSFLEEDAADSDVVVTRFAHFSWPSMPNDPGRVSIWLEHRNHLRWTGLSGDSYRDFGNTYFSLPYARAVFSTDIEQRIRKAQGGQLFTATSPDINLGAALEIEATKKIILSGITPFIVGTSSSSNGAQGPEDPTKQDFMSLNSTPWLPELGHESLATNFMSYLEPIAQARKARGLDLNLPGRYSIIWNSLLSTKFRNEICKHLISVFPRNAFLIKLLSSFSGPSGHLNETVKIGAWALARVILNREKYTSFSSTELFDSDAAAKKLQEVIDKHRKLHATRRNSLRRANSSNAPKGSFHNHLKKRRHRVVKSVQPQQGYWF